MISLRSLCPGALIVAAAGTLPAENASARRLQVAHTFLMSELKCEYCCKEECGHVSAFWAVTFCRSNAMELRLAMFCGNAMRGWTTNHPKALTLTGSAN